MTSLLDGSEGIPGHTLNLTALEELTLQNTTGLQPTADLPWWYIGHYLQSELLHVPQSTGMPAQTPRTVRLGCVSVL